MIVLHVSKKDFAEKAEHDRCDLAFDVDSCRDLELLEVSVAATRNRSHCTANFG